MGLTEIGPSGSPRLIEEIRLRIKRSPDKALSFRDYMELCLYHPEWGYYSRAAKKIGKEGDFYTSSGIGTVMGEMLGDTIAAWCMGAQRSSCPFYVVEWGGGSGRLACQILDHLEQAHQECYANVQYILIDHSAYHRQVQSNLLESHRDKVNIYSDDEWFENGPHDAFIFSNELLDAFPVHRVCLKDGRLHEIYVGWDDLRACFHEILVPAENGPLANYLQQARVVLAEGQKAEINLQADEWIRNVGKRMTTGLLMTIDYGAQADEIYAYHRMKGTLMCYRKHQGYDDPYRYIGEQDITAHVNFSAITSAGQEVGMNDWTYQTQRDFLVDCGILDGLRDDIGGDPFGPVARKNRAIRQILWSDQMSELFKVLIQRKKSV